MITLILFLVILSVLVAVHEAGHLILAKAVGARVREYAIGFPPRLFSKKWRGTEYSLNLTPLGGYVNIAGEEGIDDPSEADVPVEEKLASKHPFKKILVLVAGVTANVILAWVLLSITLMLGTFEPVPTDAALPANAQVMILGTLPDSPAKIAGLSVYDAVSKVESGGEVVEPKRAEDLVKFLEAHQDEKINFTVLRDGNLVEIKDLQAVSGLSPDKKALGIGIETVVEKSYPFFTALYKGVDLTWETLKAITISAGQALNNIVHGNGGFTEVAGPVGIGKIAGEARQLGLVAVLNFAAFLSIDLAIINILPFPALDGGRVVFTIFEWIAGRRVPTKVSRAIHGAGFVILIILIIVVTIHDIGKFF